MIALQFFTWYSVQRYKVQENIKKYNFPMAQRRITGEKIAQIFLNGMSVTIISLRGTLLKRFNSILTKIMVHLQIEALLTLAFLMLENYIIY